MTLTVWEIDGAIPVVDPTAYVHPTAVLIGDVIIGPGCYVGPTACLRGDFGRLEMHAGSNVQDGCILHAFPGNGTVIEENGHIGHGAILHGCTVKRNALVGMNAVINDNAVIGESALHQLACDRGSLTADNDVILMHGNMSFARSVTEALFNQPHRF